jgi:mannose-6-phosphate isomerase-like protein (cupin superfamily)
MPQPTTHGAATKRSPHSHRSPFVVDRDEGEHLALGDITIIVKATAESTAGSLTVFEEVPPLGDVGLHIHHNEDEIYYVLEGEHEFVCGEQVFRLSPGATIFMPRGVPHAHSRVVPGAGRLLGVTSPAGFDGFFRALAEASGAGALHDETYAEVSAQYGIEWVT